MREKGRNHWKEGEINDKERKKERDIDEEGRKEE